MQAVGTTYTLTIPSDGRVTLYLECVTATPMCSMTMTHSAGGDIRLYTLYNNSITFANEGFIRQEINTFGTINFRKSIQYMMFVNTNNVSAQTVTVYVLGAMDGIVSYSVKAFILMTTLYYIVVG